MNKDKIDKITGGILILIFILTILYGLYGIIDFFSYPGPKFDGSMGEAIFLVFLVLTIIGIIGLALGIFIYKGKLWAKILLGSIIFFTLIGFLINLIFSLNIIL